MERVRTILKPLYLHGKRALLQTRLRFVPVTDFSAFRRVLVIAPHPDDEVLGTGGVILRLLKEKREVFVWFLTDGEHSLPDLDPGLVARNRVGISARVLESLGVPEENVFRFGFPDGKLPRAGHKGFDRAAGLLSEVLSDVKPEVVLVTHPLETWPYDHVAAAELVPAALESAGAAGVCVYGYWVWLPYSLPVKGFGGIDWKRTVRVPLGGRMAAKKRFMEEYLAPLSPNGRPWSGTLPKGMLAMFDYPFEIMTKIEK